MSIYGVDPSANLREGKRCPMDSLFFTVAVTSFSYVQCSIVVINGSTTEKRESQLIIIAVRESNCGSWRSRAAVDIQVSEGSAP